MSEKPLRDVAAEVTVACAKLQATLTGELSPMPPGPYPSVTMLTNLIHEHQELLARLSSSAEAEGRSDEHAEIAAVAAKRERVLAQGLDAMGAVAVSMRAVLDDVAELAPPDNGYLPSVQELLAYGHRLRYTTFATTGLYAGEPAPQQLHFDHAALWERALAERHQQMAAGGAAAAAAAGGAAAAADAAPVDPRAEAACRTLLDNLVEAGWTPEAGFPEPMLAVLSEMPGAVDVLRRLVEERFFGGAAGAAAPAAAPAPPPTAPKAPTGANPASRLAERLMIDEETDEEDSSDEETSDDDDDD